MAFSITPVGRRLRFGVPCVPENPTISRRVHGINVVGLAVDPQTRCSHFAGPTDVIAIKFKCCATFYPCIDCHRALADHEPRVWPIGEHDAQAVLCGVCGATLAIADYLNGDSSCPRCGAGFNPGCKLHHHLYFETACA